MNPSFDLSGKRALVTGSSRGIGAAIAKALASAGADVAINYAGSAEGAEATASAVRELGRRALVVQADLLDPQAPRRVFDAVAEGFGGLDILVSNVAVQFAEPWTEVSREHFDQQAIINWRSAFELIQLFAPAMLERGWGRILTIGSVQEAKPNPAMVVYAGLKSAQTTMVRNLARQFASRGVTVNNLAPGVIRTGRSEARLADPAYRETVMGWIPARFLGEPEDCAGAALLLCSDAGRYITGQSLYVDGGMSLP